MHPLHRVTAAVLLAVMLAGCGATAQSPAGGMPVAAQASAIKSFHAANVANAADVEKAIGELKALAGSWDEAAMGRRTALVARLGDSDDDKAFAFLQAEYENLDKVPATVRDAYEDQIMEGLDGLDTFDEELDEEILAAGPGEAGSIQALAYEYAASRKRRKKGFIHWLGTPFRWVGRGLGKAWDKLRGKKKRKKRRRTPPGYPPSYPSDPGYGGGYEYPSRRY